jgi:hypothetical protein
MGYSGDSIEWRGNKVNNGIMGNGGTPYPLRTTGNQTSLRDNIFQLVPSDAGTIDSSLMRETTFTFDWMGNQTSRARARPTPSPTSGTPTTSSAGWRR